jgi:hypothetical protein
LASDLGIPVPPEEVVTEQPKAVSPPPPPPPSPPPREPVTPRPARASSTNWDSLASDLGLEVEPPPVVAKTPSSDVPSAATSPPSGGKQRRRATPAPDTPEESPNFFDERFDFEEPFDLLESPDAAAAIPPPTHEQAKEKKEPEERDRHTRKRRSRRRPGKERDRRDSAEPTPGETIEQTAVEATTAADGFDDLDQAEVDVAAEQVVEKVAPLDGEPSETGPRPSKHRRSRRGRKKESREEPKPAAAVEPSRDEVQARPPKSPREDLHDRRRAKDDDSDMDEEVESETGSSARQGFRGIPTWDEAVGLVIAKNLEARSKRGGGSGGKPRQSRDSGNRGSREQRGRRGGGRRRS